MKPVPILLALSQAPPFLFASARSPGALRRKRASRFMGVLRCPLFRRAIHYKLMCLHVAIANVFSLINIQYENPIMRGR